MSFTIENFLELEIIRDATIVTTKDTIKNKSIESISVIELPVENFVHQNELVLTTCIGCTNEDSIFLNFIRDVYNSGASCLVISTGRYVKSTPQSVIDYANSIDFPIIEIPWNIRFAGIIESVLEEINNKKQANSKVFESIQKKLLMLFLDGATLSEAANLIYKELGNQAVIVNSSGTIKGSCGDSEELLNIIEEPLNILFSEKNLSLLKNYDTKDIYTVYKIRSRNIIYGYLYLKTKNDGHDYVANNKVLVVRHIVSAISLWFDREHTIFETEMHHKDKYIWALIQADQNELNELYMQSKMMGYNLSLPYICMVGMISDFDEAYTLERSNFSSYEEWKFESIKSIKSQIIRIGKASNMEVMITYQEDLLIVFLEAAEEDIEKLANAFIDDIECRVKPIYPHIVFSWGISAYRADYKQFKKLASDAKISLEFGHKNNKLGFRYIHHNTDSYKLLTSILNDTENLKIVESTIGELLNYDSENRLDLITTFKSYIQNNGNVSKTARDLHLHRQSLLYRLKRIEEITNLSLDNYDDVFLLELCIRLSDAQKY